MADVSVYVTSEQTSSERRISPSWTISHLKTRLEQITGIPPSSQRLLIYGTASTVAPVAIENVDEDNTDIGLYNLVPFGRIHVEDSRPAGAQTNFQDVSEVEKYVMSENEYSGRHDTVLRWKKENKLGRFDPNLASSTSEKEQESQQIVKSHNIKVGLRCRVKGGIGERRGVIKHVGPVPEINASAPNLVWVGIEFDEPLGKNDGSIKGRQYFSARPTHGSFIKPELVEVGDFTEQNYDLDDEEL